MNTNVQQYLIPLAIVAAGALIAVGIYFGGTKTPAAQQVGQQDQIATTEITSDGPFIGNPNAPLTVYYWSDYQCPFCKQFESTSLQTLIKDYVTTNKVKVVFKDMQFLGQDSVQSAFIARAIWDLYPDKYFAWREGYFEKQDDEGDVGFGDKESVIAYTKTVAGIDTEKVLARIEEKKDEFAQQMTEDHSEGVANNVTGTPGVIVGNTKSQNPLSYPALKSLVDSQLK